MNIPEHALKILESADKHIAAGRDVYFKFTCLGCGARQTFELMNALFTEGKCEECGHISSCFDPAAKLNYLLVVDTRAKGSQDFLADLLDQSIRRELNGKEES